MNDIMGDYLLYQLTCLSSQINQIIRENTFGWGLARERDLAMN